MLGGRRACVQNFLLHFLVPPSFLPSLLLHYNDSYHYHRVSFLPHFLSRPAPARSCSSLCDSLQYGAQDDVRCIVVGARCCFVSGGLVMTPALLLMLPAANSWLGYYNTFPPSPPRRAATTLFHVNSHGATHFATTRQHASYIVNLNLKPCVCT